MDMKSESVIRKAGVLLLCCMAVYMGGCAKKAVSPPVAKVVPHTDTYHGVQVVDNYQWMENGKDSAVQKWDKAQNDYTRSVLDAIPCRSEIESELRTLYDKSSDHYGGFAYKAGKLFAMKTHPPNDQPMLVRINSPQDLAGEVVIVDPNKLDTTGRTAIDFFDVSQDGSLVAVSMSHGGTELGDLSVFRVDDGRRLSDQVSRVNAPTAGGSVAWAPDNSGFFYTHYPHVGERPAADLRFYQQIYWHQLGTLPEKDSLVLGKDFPRIAEIALKTSPDGSRILATVSNGDGGQYYHWLRQSSGKWAQLTKFDDDISTAKFGPDNSLYFLSTKDADMGKILHLAAGKTNLKDATTIVDESDAVLKDFLPTRDDLFVCEMLGGPMQLRVLDKGGALQKRVPVRPVSSVGGLISLGDDRVMYHNVSYLEPGAWYVYDPGEGKSTLTQVAATSTADFSDIEAVREQAISKDGTKVPMTVLRQKGTKLDGSNPTILYGYGGYGLSQSPWYDESLITWLKRGGVYVIANIRGGGEFGEEWHKKGYLTQKQNVFDDFAACAEHLIDTGYTDKNHLAIRGGSNGGLLVGAVMVQHPDLFKAVVCQRGVLDPLRVELFPNGEFNTTEFGSVKNRDQFEALYAYSPYANVKDGVDYPDVLFTADLNDGRVDPSNSRKMVARLQAADKNKSLTLLRMSSGGGHGIGMSRSDRISRDADIWAFLFDRLGLKCN